MMEPTLPEDWWPLFQRAMRDGDLDAVLCLYEPGAVIADATGEILSGHTELRTMLEPLVSAHADFHYDIRKVVQNENLALVHCETRLTRPRARAGYALEVLRHQPDGRWLLAIGDPFTIGQRLALRSAE